MWVCVSIAVEMDQMQSKMVSILLKLPKRTDEPIEIFRRRRNKVSAQFCSKVGQWSLAWAAKVIQWHEHVQRSGQYNAINSRLLKFHNQEWLLHRRAEWIAQHESSISRVTAFAGWTGTRLNVGQPQPRWEEGLALAKTISITRGTSFNGNTNLSIGIRIREAMCTLRSIMESF